MTEKIDRCCSNQYSLEWSAGVHLQPVWDLGCVVRVSRHQHRLVPLCRTWLIGDRRW